MSKINELSAFQRNLNSLTLYLYLMNRRCKHLKDYDDEGDFDTHNYFFKLCQEKLKDEIENDENLLINNHIFNKYFSTFENDKKSANKIKLNKKDNDYIYNAYFDYSKSLSKSKFRNKAYTFISWSLLIILILFFVFAFIVKMQNYDYKKSFDKNNKTNIEETIGNKDLKKNNVNTNLEENNKDTNLDNTLKNQELEENSQNDNLGNYYWDKYLLPYLFILVGFIVSLDFLIRGIILHCVINKKKNNRLKFIYLYSDDYSYKRIKEAEAFFRAQHNVENDYLELSEIERKFPEKDNMFYNTIMETKTINEDGRNKLIKINHNLYCRAVFAELFKSIKEDGIEQSQQISFVFKICKENANVEIKGNTAFAECVNHIYGKTKFTDTTFNQALPKLKNPKTVIQPKYLKILEKYENIL